MENEIKCIEINKPVNCQANSIEEMKIKIPKMFKMLIKMMEDITDKNSFEFVDETEQWEMVKNK